MKLLDKLLRRFGLRRGKPRRRASARVLIAEAAEEITAQCWRPPPRPGGDVPRPRPLAWPKAPPPPPGGGYRASRSVNPATVVPPPGGTAVQRPPAPSTGTWVWYPDHGGAWMPDDDGPVLPELGTFKCQTVRGQW